MQLFPCANDKKKNNNKYFVFRKKVTMIMVISPAVTFIPSNIIGQNVFTFNFFSKISPLDIYLIAQN